MSFPGTASRASASGGMNPCNAKNCRSSTRQTRLSQPCGKACPRRATRIEEALDPEVLYVDPLGSLPAALRRMAGDRGAHDLLVIDVYEWGQGHRLPPWAKGKVDNGGYPGTAR